MYTKICEYCGKEFTTKNVKSRFCSHKCSSEYVKTHPKPKDYSKLVLVECATCHKQEYVTPSRAKNYVCCSTTCLGKRNSLLYAKKVKLICPICGIEYECKQSAIEHHKTCGSTECRKKWLQQTRKGENNFNYKKIENLLKSKSIQPSAHDASKTIYLHVVKEQLGLPSVKAIPKGYVIHHKDADHNNNNPENIVVLPKSTHRLIHTWFGNVMINALHTGKISREDFFKMCDEESAIFYKEIIDLNVTHQAVVKQGELLGSPEVGNQQPSIYRNIIEGSTTNSRVLADNAEDSNADTSALPTEK